MFKKLHNWGPLAAWLAITAGWMLSTAFMPAHFVRAALSVVFLLLVPGFFVYRTIVGAIPRQLPLKTLSYSAGLSILVLMVSGLALNELASLAGNTRPLTQGNLTLLIGLVAASLTILSHLRNPLRWAQPQITRQKVLRALSAAAPLAILPLLAIGGANMLNNGGGNWLALTAAGLAGLGIVIGVWQKGRLDRYLPYMLYSLALTIMLATSMRGWFITGHDIMQEYQVFQLTLQHSAWHMAYYHDAYNACLSITVLPTILQKLTGIVDPYIYKFVFQLFAVLLAPVLYMSLRPYLKRTVAFLVAAALVTFPTFITDITMLNRQETALLFMLLAIMAGLDKQLGRRARSLLAFLLLSGMVLSHYSTSYIFVSILLISLGIGVGLTLLAKVIRRLPKPQTVFVIFRPAVIVATLMVLLIWNTFATETSNNVAATIKGIGQSIPMLFSGQGLGGSSSKIGGTSSGIVSQYAAFEAGTRTLPKAEYYPVQAIQSYPLVEQKDTQTAEPAALKQAGVPPGALQQAFGLSRTAYGALIEGLIVVGLILLCIRRVRTRLPVQYTVLGIAALIIIAAQVALPSSVINYGLLRVLQQALLLLAAPIILAALWILGLFRIPETARLRIVGLVLALFFLILSGFIPTLTGGDKPSLALASDGFYYQAYLTHADEIAADQWLHDKTPVGSRVYADEFARRKMIAYSGIFSQPTLVPAAYPVDSYIYLSHGDTQFDKVPFYYNGELSFYSVPYGFLDANKNLVYTSGGVEIYK